MYPTPRFCLTLIILCLFLVSAVVAETYEGDDAGYGDFAPQSGDTSGGGGDGEIPEGDGGYGGFAPEGGGYGGLTPEEVQDYGSQLLDLRLWVVCWHPDRDEGINGDGLPDFVVGDSFRGYGYIEQDSESLPAIINNQDGNVAFPSVSASWLDETNPKNFRYEGSPWEGEGTGYPFHDYGCIPAIGSYHILNVFPTVDTIGLGFAINWAPLEGFFADKINVALNPEGTAYRQVELVYKFPLYGENGAYSRNIVWDENQQQCGVIGGDWLSEPSFDGVQCCGDDTIWHKNRQINFAANKQRPLSDSDDLSQRHSFCLYGKDLNGNVIPIIFTSSSYGQIGPYQCGETDFYPYDPKLVLDDNYDENVAEDSSDETSGETARRLAPYLFAEGGLTETDLGKWSDLAEKNPQVCTYSFDETSGDVYEWKTLAKGADLSEEQCTFLGGSWTGTKCCGTKYDYATEKYLDESFHDPSAVDAVVQNKACIAAAAVASGESKVVDLNGEEEGQAYELLSLGGNVYGCAVENPSVLGNDSYTEQLLLAETNKPACGIVKQVQQAFVCDPLEKKFQSVVSTYARETMGAPQQLLIADLPESLPLSSPPWDTAASAGCCFNNGCWNGEACAAELTSKITDVDGEEIHYTCYQGGWGNPLAEDFDWYYNTDVQDNSRAFCVQPSSCSCSTNPTDLTYCGEVGEDIAANGCTLEENFVVDDHLCESFQDASLPASRWTSRTKILALQLLQIAQSAGSTSYSIFCDDAEHALHNPSDVVSFTDDVNQFCVLRYQTATDQQVVVGTTFNTDELEETLFGTTGFIAQVFDDEISESSCNNALTASSSNDFGNFAACTGNTLWINPQLNAVLYSAESLSSVPTLDVAVGNAFLYDQYDALAALVDDQSEDIDPGHILGADVFDHMSSFDTFYLAVTPTTTTFGFEEEKYDGEISHENRFYTGVLYDSVTLDCDAVYEAYGLANLGAQVYCSSGQESMILEKSTSGSNYWQDLTAKLRW